VLGGYAKRVTIWTCASANKWKQECVLEEGDTVVHDVAWAPSMGRTYHLIASASRTNSVTVHRVKRLSDGSVEPESSVRLECPSPVWRVSWNATGTMLSTSGENGALSLWRKGMNGEWTIVQANVVNSVPVSSSYATPAK
jgi:nucleoporin SEH1